MSIESSIIITLMVSFILSLLSDTVRSFLLKLPGKIFKYFRDRNFKYCVLYFGKRKDIEELGNWYSCFLDGKTYIMNDSFLPKETVKSEPSISNQKLSLQKIDDGKEITETNTGPERSDVSSLTNEQIIEMLDKFFYIDERKKHCILSKTIYEELRNKLKKRKIHLVASIDHDDFKKIPFNKLSERDFDCFDSQLSIEIKKDE